MNVATILNEKGREVATCTADVSLTEIARILSGKKIGCIVVVDGDDERVIGIVSERDFVSRIARKGADGLDEPVEKCMTCEVITARESDTIEKLMTEMTTHRFRHMPVVEDGRLVGIVSIGDVVKQRIAETEMEAAAMRDYIATG